MDLKDAKFRIEIMKFEFEKLSEKKPESKELFLKYNEAVDTVLQELENRIPKKKIEDKIEELNEGIKRDIENYDKIKDESWKKAIHHSITQKNESKKILQELLGGK